MTDIYDRVFVGPSRIDGAGQGLFARVNIRSGYRICPYEGELLSEKEFEDRYSEDYPSYAIPFPGNALLTIDPRDVPDALGRYANASDYPGARLRANAELVAVESEYRVYLVALRNIRADDEILFNYGRGYWERLENYESDDSIDEDIESLGSETTDDSELEY